MVNKNEIFDFLNDAQQKTLKPYRPLDVNEYPKMKKRDYVKFVNRRNYSFDEGGLILDFDIPRIKILRWENRTQDWIDLTYFIPFWKQNMKNISRRGFFERLLENLNNR